VEFKIYLSKIIADFKSPHNKNHSSPRFRFRLLHSFGFRFRLLHSFGFGFRLLHSFGFGFGNFFARRNCTCDDTFSGSARSFTGSSLYYTFLGLSAFGIKSLKNIGVASVGCITSRSFIARTLSYTAIIICGPELTVSVTA